MKKYFFILSILISSQICRSQTTETLKLSLDNEGLATLNDTLLQKEISSFTISGTNQITNYLFVKSKLIEIPLYYCSDDLIYFTKGSTFIHLYPSKFDTSGHKLSFEYNPSKRLVLIDNNPFWGTDGTIPQTKMDSIFLVIHSNFLVKFPSSAFKGIYEPNKCSEDGTPLGKKRENGVISLDNVLSSPFLKAFQSPDKSRFYIYLLNGQGDSQYEVTWVIQNGKYLTRIVNRIN